MNYYLAESCQNTFVLVDCLHLSTLSPTLLNRAHRALLKEERDDALLLFNKEFYPNATVLQMAVLGCDGKIAEFCGNGSRAAAAYLFSNYPIDRPVYLKTPQGLHLLSFHGKDFYSIHLPKASFTLNPKFVKEHFKEEYPFTFVDMLEPHLLVQEDLSDAALHSLGKKLNARKDLFPCGINVNAWTILAKDHLYVKTYERGVQRLTKSCGTGSLSCAAFYSSPKVCVETPGGILEIFFGSQGMMLKGSSTCNLYPKEIT